MGRLKSCVGVVFLVAVGACSRAITPLVTPESAVALTSGPNTSMIYLARTTDGVLAIDLGWWGHERALETALSDLRAARGDIKSVFLTHSHRDHIGSWRSVRRRGDIFPAGWLCTGEARLLG